MKCSWCKFRNNTKFLLTGIELKQNVNDNIAYPIHLGLQCFNSCSQLSNLVSKAIRIAEEVHKDLSLSPHFMWMMFYNLQNMKPGPSIVNNLKHQLPIENNVFLQIIYANYMPMELPLPFHDAHV